MAIKAIITILGVTLLAASCGRHTDEDEFEGEIFTDQMAFAKGGNVIVTETGMNIHMLGVKEDEDAGTAFLQKYAGENIHVIADSRFDQDPVGTDSIWGYAVLDDGRCINHLLLMQEPQLFSPINLEDSLESFRPVRDDLKKILDIGIYLKQRSFMVEMPVGGGLSSYGTAFFINDQGIALTNNHVFDGSEDAYCHFYSMASTDDSGLNPDKRYDAYAQDILYTDPELDLTVFKVSLPQGSKSNYFNLAKKHIAIGEDIFTIGNPVGQGEILTASISNGIVSGYRYQDSAKPMVQYTLSTNYGNSGGPVCDKNGNVIAVHAMGDKTKQNVNYGIDILAVRKELANLELYYGGK